MPQMTGQIYAFAAGCPKCRAPAGVRSHCARCRVRSTEHHHCGCTNCGFSWMETTADAKPAKGKGGGRGRSKKA